MTVEVFKEFTFDAMHFLSHLPEGHQCKRIHGHTYHVTVYAQKPKNELVNGMVVDYSDIKAVWDSECKSVLDHRPLNDPNTGEVTVPGVPLTTSENLAVWIYEKMRAAIPEVSKVTVKETATAGSTYPAGR